MKWTMLCLSILTLFACKSTKSESDTTDGLKLVITLKSESDISYLVENYKEDQLVYIDRLSRSTPQYLFEYKGPRTKAVDLKKRLAQEPVVLDISNYVVPKDQTGKVTTSKGRKGSSSSIKN